MLLQPLTLVALLPDRLVRADFTSSRAVEPSQFAVRDRPDIDDQASLVEIALSLVSKRPGRTFVLSSEVWTHTLGVPLTNLRNTPAEEVRQMLAFDAEPLSNLSAFEAATGVLPLGDSGGTRNFWVTQVGTAIRDQIDDAVRAAGGKFAGVLHAAGVPQTIDGGVSSAGGAGASLDAGRIEYWPSVTARTAIRGGKIIAAKVDDSGLGADRVAAAQAWRTEAGVATVDTLDGSGRRTRDDLPALNLSDEEVLRRWLAAWNRALRARTIEAPVVTASARPMTQRQQGMVAAVLGLVVLGACYGHNEWVKNGIEAANTEQTALEAPGKEVASLKQQASTIEKDLTKVREEEAKLKIEVTQAEAMFDSHRRRLPELLRRLSADPNSSRDWVLQKISGSGRELTLAGTTMHPEHISRLASELSVDLESLGWGVEPPKQDARNLVESGGPWAFELKLVDRKHTQAVTPATPAPANPIAGSTAGQGPSKVIIRTP
jgi:hypothetical protein